jgi:hypothetical protein
MTGLEEVGLETKFHQPDFFAAIASGSAVRDDGTQAIIELAGFIVRSELADKGLAGSPRAIELPCCGTLPVPGSGWRSTVLASGLSDKC